MSKQSKKEKERLAFQLRKAYWKLRRNYYGLLKHNMLTENEQRVMYKELQAAENAWKQAEE